MFAISCFDACRLPFFVNVNDQLDGLGVHWRILRKLPIQNDSFSDDAFFLWRKKRDVSFGALFLRERFDLISD